jgi:broad specificity phosphatase PhoE
VWRGNRGSTAEELEKRPEFQTFDFDILEKYCEDRCVKAKDPAQAGKWWHHGPHSEETEASFRRRMVSLKRWLGGLSASQRSHPQGMGRVMSWLNSLTFSQRSHPLRVVLVCHGGVMQEAFQFIPNAPNCGFRVFDVEPGGRTLHVSSGVWLEENDLTTPAFSVSSVTQQGKRVDGHLVYDIELRVGDDVFACSKRESELREGLHDMVRSSMTSEAHERFRLSGLFPRSSLIGRHHRDPSINIQDYLEQLAVAMGDSAFDADVARRVGDFLLEGRL